MAAIFPYFLVKSLTKRPTAGTNFLGVIIREISAPFPKLRELTLKPCPEYAGTVDDLAMKLLSVISSPHLSRVALDHTTPYSFGLAVTDKWREADRTMVELTRRIGREVAFSWYFAYAAEDAEPIIRPLLEKIDRLGMLRILEGDEEVDAVIEDGPSEIIAAEADWTNVPFSV
jgi:hypothetical protein